MSLSLEGLEVSKQGPDNSSEKTWRHPEGEWTRTMFDFLLSQVPSYPEIHTSGTGNSLCPLAVHNDHGQLSRLRSFPYIGSKCVSLY